MFDRWQTLIASFDYINASFIYIIKACNYKNETCIRSLDFIERKFSMYELEATTFIEGVNLAPQSV